MNTLHAKNGCIYIIGCLLRPGALSFAVDLEHKYFTPDTELNELYNIFHLKYQDMPWYIIEIPASSYNIAAKLTTELGLKLVNGKPVASTGLEKEFGLLCNAEQCFTLENNEHVSEWQSMLQKEQQHIRERLKMNASVSLNE